MDTFTVECRMRNGRGKTVTKTTNVKARDGIEARAKARQVFIQRGNNSVESLYAHTMA